jgi:ligand-binding SRPBCC domain-containing protein
VNTPIDRVWEFYIDIKHLEIVTPKEMKLKIINATSEKLSQGSEIWFEAKLIISKTSWHSVITSLKPYQYVDEMLTGPFKKWRHLHRFSKIDKHDQKQLK